MIDDLEAVLSSLQNEEFTRLLAERTNGLPVTPELAEKVSLLPITVEEAKGIRAQIATLQKNVIRAHELALQAQNTSAQAMDTATLAKTATDAVKAFSGRLLEIEFKLTRIMEALAAHEIEVDLAARQPPRMEEKS